MPSVIEYPRTIAIIVMNDGTEFLTFSKSILTTFFIISTPTYINALAAAAEGINANNGNKNIDTRNYIATTNAVRPVFPPAETPAPLSTNVVTVLVPSIAPAIVAVLSDIIILS